MTRQQAGKEPPRVGPTETLLCYSIRFRREQRRNHTNACGGRNGTPATRSGRMIVPGRPGALMVAAASRHERRHDPLDSKADMVNRVDRRDGQAAGVGPAPGQVRRAAGASRGSPAAGRRARRPRPPGRRPRRRGRPDRPSCRRARPDGRDRAWRRPGPSPPSAFPTVRPRRPGRDSGPCRRRRAFVSSGENASPLGFSKSSARRRSASGPPASQVERDRPPGNGGRGPRA